MEENQAGRQHEIDQPVTRAYLESLTTSDLIKMADKFGIDLPSDLDRIFIIEELLGIELPDENESTNSSDHDLMDSVSLESVPLPRQYNISFIEVMIRDPLWAFVFWEIKAQEKEQYEKAQDFEGYFLKVSPLEKSPETSAGSSRQEKGVFSIPVKSEDSAWYLGLDQAAADSGRTEQDQYKVELCAAFRDEEIVIAVSKPVKLPELPVLPSGSEKPDVSTYGNPLVHLSGYRDFHMLRRIERLPRAKKDYPAGFYE